MIIKLRPNHLFVREQRAHLDVEIRLFFNFSLNGLDQTLAEFNMAARNNPVGFSALKHFFDEQDVAVFFDNR